MWMLSAGMRRISAGMAAGSQHLTKQLNDFRPVNVEQVAEQFEQMLNLQSTRIDVVTESVQKAQKAVEDNAE